MTTFIGTQIIAQLVGAFVLKCLNHYLYCNPDGNSVSMFVDNKMSRSRLILEPDHSSVGMCVGDKMSP